jgi:hypothetical protein
LIESSSFASVSPGWRAPPLVDFSQLLVVGFTRSLTGANLQIQMVAAGVAQRLEMSTQMPLLLT